MPTIQSAHPARRAAASRMRTAAVAFIDGLGTAQRECAHWTFPCDGERRQWFYTPTDHGGLTLGEMSPLQQSRGCALLATGLSDAAFATVSTLMSLENILDHEEGHRSRAPYERYRDPGRYFIRIFGDPGNRHWGWRFGGHHISLNYAIVDGELAAGTPCFLGANPASTTLLGGVMLRPLGTLQDTALDLMSTLTAQQHARAVVAPVAPLDIIGGNRSSIATGDDGVDRLPMSEIWRDSFEAHVRRRMDASELAVEQQLGLTDAHRRRLRLSARPIGLAAADMTTRQRDALHSLLRQFVGRLPEPVAEVELAKLTPSRFDRLHLAWAGPTQAGEPIYYRLQGDGLVVEFDNTQRGANHVHSVWRDPRGDFGNDLLAEHYTDAHRAGHAHAH